MGRTSVLMIIGFNIVFAIMGYNISRVAVDAYNNYVSYYERSAARQIAASGANMAASQISFTTDARPKYSDVAFGGGTYSVNTEGLDSGRVRVTVEALYDTSKYFVVLTLGQTKFSKFAYFSKIEGDIVWTAGDSVWGAFHTQQKLTVSGNPVFMGKVTAKNGITKNPKSSKPEFNGGFESGVSIDLPKNFDRVKDSAQNGGRYFDNKDIYLQFNSNGTVTYRVGSWTAFPSYTMSLSPLADNPLTRNGILFVNRGNLHIKGTVNGQITIAATGSSGFAKGNVWVDSSVVYKTNPMADPSSTDMLGILCDNDVIVANNSNNSTSAGVTLHASMLCKSGGLKAEDYNFRTPAGAPLNVLGGIQQYQRGTVATIRNGIIKSGFLRKYRYDERLMIGSPPLYPTTGTYEVLSWYEN